MKSKEFYDHINDLKGRLPSPSDVECNDLLVPSIMFIDGVIQVVSITLTKDVHDGIVIGWKLK